MVVCAVMVCLGCMVYISNQVYSLCFESSASFRLVNICDVVSLSECCKNAEV